MEKGSKDRKDSPTSSERFENLSYERHLYLQYNSLYCDYGG